MKTCWLRQNGSKDCILFMAGWGMGPEPFQEVAFGPADVLMVYDYRRLNDAIFSGLADQGNLHLLAWSMGVWVAAWLAQHDAAFSQLRFSSSTAIGGTLRPIDDQCGIPVQRFEAMLEEFSPSVLENFYCSMFACPEEAERFLRRKPQRPWQELGEELNCLYKFCRRSSENLSNIYNHRIVTARDRIFLSRNQIRAWGRNNCTSAALPHFPWYSRLIAPSLSPLVLPQRLSLIN